MASGAFPYEEDPLKHYVRIKGWLPLCLARQRRLQKRRASRRLKYFTFCAVNAFDVIMLDVAKVIHRSKNGHFDTVCFFDRTPEFVAQTQLRIPGSIGFHADFLETVLDPFEGNDPLAEPSDRDNTYEVRAQQRLHDTKQEFKKQFPFDVVNLDLQGAISTPKDTIPGDVVNAIRKLCQWQRQPLVVNSKLEPLDGFTLLFTTRVEATTLGDKYAEMLLDILNSNLLADTDLAEVLRQRNGLEVGQLQEKDFHAFFELGVPKLIAKVLMQEDWHIEQEPGVLVYRFRRAGRPPYDIVHFAMDVNRNSPPLELRTPDTTIPVEARTSYKAVVRRLFETPTTHITDALASGANLKPSLQEIRTRLHMYYHPDNS
jgi:hypothetical protein